MIDANSKLIDTYLELINRMNFESKLELISRLSSSMKEEMSASDESVLKLYGAFESEKSAEEIIALIREARTFNRKIEHFD